MRRDEILYKNILVFNNYNIQFIESKNSDENGCKPR